MAVRYLDRTTMKLHPKELEMLEDDDLTLFHISHWELDFRNEADHSEGIWMTVTLKRKIMSEMMTTYLPSILLLMITFATTFFNPIYFEAALSVNLTTMLMMTTISIGKMQMLPTTAYIRMIDIWLVFCQLVPFAEVILLTAQEYFRDDGNEEDQNDIVGSVIVGSEKNKTGPGIIVQVAEKSISADAFEDNEFATPGEANSSNPKKMQQLKTLGDLKIHKLYHNAILCSVNISEKKILPMTVVMFSLVYFGVASTFYLA